MINVRNVRNLYNTHKWDDGLLRSDWSKRFYRLLTPFSFPHAGCDDATPMNYPSLAQIFGLSHRQVILFRWSASS
jgi:hypothetical protein